MDNWNVAYSWVMNYSGNALITDSLRTGDGILLTPIQTGEVKFQVGYNALASGDHSIALGVFAQALETQSIAM